MELELRGGVGREVVERTETDDRSALEDAGRIREGGHRNRLHGRGAGRHGRRGPLVRHRPAQAVRIELHDMSAVGTDERTDRTERRGQLFVELLRGDVDELRRDPRDELLEFDTVAERLLHVAPLGGIDRGDDEIGDRAGEVLLVDGPVTRVADVLAADDAAELPEPPHRRIGHRGDAEGDEVVVVETGGAGIETRVVRREGPLALQRTEVRRIALRGQLGAGRVLVRGADVEVRAAEDGARLVEEPDARALDLDRLGSRFGDGADREIEIAGVQGVIAREIDQDTVLASQTVFRLARPSFERRAFTFPGRGFLGQAALAPRSIAAQRHSSIADEAARLVLCRYAPMRL